MSAGQLESYQVGGRMAGGRVIGSGRTIGVSFRSGWGLNVMAAPMSPVAGTFDWPRAAGRLCASLGRQHHAAEPLPLAVVGPLCCCRPPAAASLERQLLTA